MRLFLLVILTCFSSIIFAESLGVYGAIYKIAEPDMLSEIHQKLIDMQDSGKLAKMEEKVKQRVQAHAIRPNPVKGIGTVSKTTSFYFTPTVTLQHAIYDVNGKLLYPAGTKVNALDPAMMKKVNPYASLPVFNETLLFINSDDNAQVKWAERESSKLDNVKIILVNGSLIDASNVLGRVYFDQNGVICQHFGIKAVPAKLVRKGAKLKITEFSLS